ncbi:MAG: hypothetical protein ACYDBB_12605 [Armatimonadota bacterium]
MVSDTGEYIFFVPLRGVKLALCDMEYGDARLCHSLPESVLDSLLAEYTQLTRADTELSLEAQNNVITLYQQHVIAPLRNKTCLVYLLPSDTEEGGTALYERAKRAMDILWYGAAHLYQTGKESDFYIGLESDPITNSFSVIGLSRKTMGWRLSIQDDSHNDGLTIDFETFSLLLKTGMFHIAEVMKKDSPSQFEKVLFRGIHWLACACSQTHPETRLVNLITALEVLLGPDDREARITNIIAESTAMLLADSVEKRLGIKKQVKDYYDIRSRVVHGGVSQELSLDRLRNLTTLVANVIKALIFRKEDYQTKKAFLLWMDGIRLSASID